MRNLDRRFAPAAWIVSGIGRDSVLSELGSLTDNCLACHSGYRVVTPAMREGGP